MDTDGRPTWVRWRIVLLLMAFSFMAHFNRTSMSTAGNMRIMEQYSISPTQMGLVYSAFLLFYTLGMTPGGVFIDRFGPRAALVLMGLGSAVFCVLTGSVGMGLLAGGMILPGLLVVRSAMGLLNAPVYPAAGRVVSRWVPLSRRALANGLVVGAFPIGVGCAPLVMGALIEWRGWPLAFVVTGAATGLVALVFRLYATDRPEEHRGVNTRELAQIQGVAPKPDAPRQWWTLLRDRNVVVLTLCYTAAGYFEYLFIYWMDYYFGKVLRLDPALTRYYSFIPFLAMGAGLPLGGWISDRLQQKYGYRAGRTLVPPTAMVAAAAFLGLGIVAKNPVWIVTWFSLALGVMGAYESTAWTLAVEIGGRRGGTSAGIVNTGGNFGGMISPAVTPWVSQHLGWPWGIGLGGLVCLLGFLCWFWIRPRPPED